MANNPLESMYANWLKTLTTQQSTAPQQWQKTMADFWQMPSAYWQTVGSIMGSRAQGIQHAWEKAPQHMQALATCKSWPEFVGKAASIQGEMLANFVNLDLTTNTYRASLWNEWQNLATRNNTWPQTTSSPGTNTPPSAPKQQPEQPKAYTQQPGTFTPGPKPTESKTATQAPKAEAKEVKAEPKAQPKSFLTPKAAQPEYQSKENAGQRQPIFNQNPPRPLIAPQPQPKPVLAQAKVTTPTASQPTQQSEMSLLTGTDGIEHGTVSPTANSVMRSASGSTIAAAAARRSVVARRQSRRRSPR